MYLLKIAVLCTLCAMALGSITQNVGIALVQPADGTYPTCDIDSLTRTFHTRFYNVVDYFSQASNGQMVVRTNVGTTRDIYGVTLTSAGTSCSSWTSLILTQFRKVVGSSAQYDSIFFVFPDGFDVTGCSNTDLESSFVFAQQGPCTGGCVNFVYGCPYVNHFIYAIGRNRGLTRSHALSSSTGLQVDRADYSCQMGYVLTFPGSHRRGFNALKLRDLGLLQATDSQTGSFNTFLSATYEYATQASGAVKLLHLTGTSYYLSYRSPLDSGVDRNVNFGNKWTPCGQPSLNGVCLVHRLNSDGSSTLLAGIANGTTYAVPQSSFSIRVNWYNVNGISLSITTTGSFLSADPEYLTAPPNSYTYSVSGSSLLERVAPTAGTTISQTGLVDTAEQGSFSYSTAYAASPVLNMCWAGDDRNSTVFVRLRLNIPQAAVISSASLTMEADQQQYEAGSGDVKIIVSIEGTDNAQVLANNLLTRNTYLIQASRTLTGDWEVADEFSIDVTSHIQSIVNRPFWQARNYINIAIWSAVPLQQNVRTSQSGSYCGNQGSPYNCGPRLKVSYTGGGGGQPTPIDCVYQWSVWSTCAGGACGGTGTQSRTLTIITPAANGGAACPTETRQTQSCTMSPCAPTPVNCAYYWTTWSPCVGLCSSYGTQSRSIVITQLPQNGGAACPTVQTETNNACLTPSCPPVDCVVDWTAWSTCSGPCGSSSGTQTRTGTIRTLPAYGGAACPALTQSQSCTTAPCSQDCIVTYGAWSSCQGTCGGLTGVQQKVGTVTQVQIGSGQACPPLVVTQPCITAACASQDCVYSWSYSPCVGTCGSTGSQTRTAVVISQPVGSGAPCPAPQVVSCQTSPCTSTAVIATPLLESLTYGTISGALSNVYKVDGLYETITEVRNNIDHTYIFYVQESSALQLDIYIGAQNLYGQMLRVQWSFLGMPWTDVFTVSTANVIEYTTRITNSANARQLLYVRIVNTDSFTTRPLPTIAIVEYVAINITPATGVVAVDCIQGAWISSACSTTCGIGTQTLTRPTLQQPANGGAACGASTLTQSCADYTQCPVNCVLSGWTSYSACSATCGYGTQTRTRTIVTPAAFGGTPCNTTLTDSISCYAGPCSGVNCVWGPWSPWSTCSATCGGGTQTRTRVIALNATNGGVPCTGSTTDSQSCNTQVCPGTTVTIRAQTSLVSDSTTGNMYQVWPSAPQPITTGVNLVFSGRATDIDSLRLANAYWQIVTVPGYQSCHVVDGGLVVSCPAGTTNTASVIGGIVGRLTCSNSIGNYNGYAFANFTISC